MHKDLENGLKQLFKEVCSYYAKTIDAASEKNRKRELVLCRQMTNTAFFDLIPKRMATLAEVGHIIGCKDHATVTHSIKTIKNQCDTDTNIATEYAEILDLGRMIILPIVDKMNQKIKLSRRESKRFNSRDIKKMKKSIHNKDIHAKIGLNVYLSLNNKDLKIIQRKICPHKNVEYLGLGGSKLYCNDCEKFISSDRLVLKNHIHYNQKRVLV
jgi:hypothetical protein